MTVVVVFALEWEFAPWRRRRAFRRRRDVDGRIYETDIDSVRVVVGCAGVGAPRLPALAPNVFTHDVAACISSGLGGALVPQLGIGDIVAASQVRTHDGDCIIDADARLIRVAERCGASTAGRFVTSSRVLGTADEKRLASPAGDVVGMEDTAVLREARLRGVPAIAIRAIGDARDETLPLDFNGVIDADGGISLGGVVARLCRRPWAIPAMIRYGIRNRAAAERLAEFLERYVQGLASSA